MKVIKMSEECQYFDDNYCKKLKYDCNVREKERKVCGVNIKRGG